MIINLALSFICILNLLLSGFHKHKRVIQGIEFKKIKKFTSGKAFISGNTKQYLA